MKTKTIFVYDTETTGFGPEDRIIQFAGIFARIIDGKVYGERIINQYINPMMPIPAKASEVHHIFDKDVLGHPPIEKHIKEFVSYHNKADLVVGHNISFDIKMLQQELNRLLFPLELKTEIYCTMKESVNLCKLPGNFGNKRPKLTELYKFLFKKDLENTHDALSDVRATFDCYIEMNNLLKSK